MLPQNSMEKAARVALDNGIYHFQVSATDAVAASNTGVHAAITDTGVAQTITTNLTDPAVPRNITATVAGTSGDIKAIQVTITGTNFFDQVITEVLPVFTVDTPATKSGSKAFKTVTSIALPAHDGTGATTAIGWGDILGLHHKRETMCCIATYINLTFEGSAATIVGDADEVEKNTLDPNSSLAGTQVDAYLIVGSG